MSRRPWSARDARPAARGWLRDVPEQWRLAEARPAGAEPPRWAPLAQAPWRRGADWLSREGPHWRPPAMCRQRAPSARPACPRAEPAYAPAPRPSAGACDARPRAVPAEFEPAPAAP